MENKTSKQNQLNHLALIIDGNRRWAKIRNLKPWEGHRAGAENVDKLLEWCLELNIKEVTIYTLSTENLKRDKTELGFLFKLFKEWFRKFENDKRVKENRVRIKFIGNLSLVPKGIKNLAERIEKETSKYNNFRLNFCFAYGGRLELLEAFNKLKNKKGKINEKDITKNLWLPSEPDLIIRTGNRERTSNFLPWQSIYSEWIFLKKLWPDFTKKDLLECIKEFSLRKRNFGK